MKIIDSHVHLWATKDVQNLNVIREAVGADRMCIASIIDAKTINDNPALWAAKAAFPERFYGFAALDHASRVSNGACSAPSLVEQIDSLIRTGADGLKLIESKPTHRRVPNSPMDSDYYDAAFARLEEAGLPTVWHVADPEEFWDPALTPGWASSRGWGYDSTWTPKETFYAEVENVLRKHPKLKAIFAHFYFLSADLPRAAALLERYEGVRLDLAPGIEMLYNLSKTPEAAREFFIKYADRIIFGTDIDADGTIEHSKIRTGIITRWLESSDEYRVPDGADYLLGPPEDGVIRGMTLPEDVLEKIYAGNFEKLVGPRPKPIDKQLAIEECERIARETEQLGGDPASTRQAIETLR